MDKARILNVFDHIPTQLAKENKKYQLGKVEKGARFKDYRGCIDWLKVSGMAEVCYCLNFPELPLKGNYDDSKYKLYFSDNGLLVAMLDDEASEDLRANKNLGVYKGALYESIAADALTRQGYGLFHFKKKTRRSRRTSSSARPTPSCPSRPRPATAGASRCARSWPPRATPTSASG